MTDIDFLQRASAGGRIQTIFDRLGIELVMDEVFDPDLDDFVKVPDYVVRVGKHKGKRLTDLNFHYVCWFAGARVMRESQKRPEAEDQFRKILGDLLVIAATVITPDRLQEAKNNLLRGRSLSNHHDPMVKRVENVVLARILRVNVRRWSEIDSETGEQIYLMLMGAEEVAQALHKPTEEWI